MIEDVDQFDFGCSQIGCTDQMVCGLHYREELGSGTANHLRIQNNLLLLETRCFRSP